MFDYGKIIKRSVEIVKRHKWLWVYGALVAGGIGAGGSSGSGNKSGSTINEIKKNIKLDDVPKQITSVLGEHTSTLRDWFFSISPLTLFLVIAALLLALVIGILASLILKSWARASLIYGANLALSDKEVNLGNTSPMGKAKTKKLIVLSLIMFGIVLGTILTFALVDGTTYLLFKSQTALVAIWAILIATPSIIILTLGFFLACLTPIYAERLVVLSGYEPWDALKQGFILAKRNFLGTSIMGLVNSILTGIFGFLVAIISLIILAIPSVIMLYPTITMQEWPSPVVLILLGLFVLIFILIMSVISAACTVFKFTNWNQVFNEVMGREEKI